MSYKYKGQLSTLADMYLNTGDHEPLLEIERVYTQAAKADEYEAKAKAFDEIREYSEDQMAYDLGDSYVLSNVSYAIQKAVDETEDE